jgi:hypothetical protein
MWTLYKGEVLRESPFAVRSSPSHKVKAVSFYHAMVKCIAVGEWKREDERARAVKVTRLYISSDMGKEKQSCSL